LRPQSNAPLVESPLATTFRAFRALTQRGKGGVYQALDLSAERPRLCILKEGRRHGEPDWDGRDGRWRVRNEEKALTALRAFGVEVPRVYASFEVEGHFYLVTEFIEGVSLQSLLNKRLKRLPVGRALRYGFQLSVLLSRIHSAGWAWQDCKPSNLIVTKEGALRPVDFEGACSVNRPRPIPWVTHTFTPPESGEESSTQPRAADDLYALGVVIYHLLSGILPSMPNPAPLGALRRNVPAVVGQLVSELLDPNPQRRPAADFVARSLLSVLPSGSARPKAGLTG
jgi:serine/threonine protein kinase